VHTVLRQVRDTFKWRVFAMSADDPRRERYSRWISRLRGPEVRRRKAAIRTVNGSAPGKIEESAGFVSFPPGTFLRTDDVVAETRRLAAPFLETTERWDGRQQMLSGLVDKSELTVTSPFLQFASQPDVIDVVGQYLGLVPILASVDILLSRHFDQQLMDSQLYHCDFEDVRQVKIFLHCSDVGPDNGPLTVVRANESREIKRRIGYRYGTERYRIGDDEMVSSGMTKSVGLLGPMGTTHFVDTSTCFHFGSRLPQGNERRIVTQFQFLTPAAFALVFDLDSLPFKALAKAQGLSDAQRLLFGDDR
jgi:hypothetical protein